MRNFLFAVVVAVFGFAAVNAGEKAVPAKAEAAKCESCSKTSTAMVPLTAREKRKLELFKEVQIAEVKKAECLCSSPTLVVRRGFLSRR